MTSLLIRAFVPGADNTDDPAVRSRYGKLAGLVGIVCNLILFAGKLLAGFVSGSLAIMADAMNNLTDATSSIVTLLGFKLSERPADKDHPFGHARFEYLSGLAVAVLILLIGFELGKGSVEKILAPQPVEFGLLPVAILVLSILVKLWMAAFNRTVGRRIGSTTLEAAAADSRNDVIATGAVLAATVLAWALKINLDGWMGLAVAVFILYSGIGILKDTVDPLLGEAPTEELTAAISEKLMTYDKVQGIHDLIVHDYGPGRRFASVHVEMDSRLDVMIGHDLIDNIERDFAQQLHIQLVIHYDPIVVGDPLVDSTKAWVSELVTAIDSRLRIHDFRMVPGASHTNVIFDVVRPQDLPLDAEALRRTIKTAVTAAHPDYFAVIQVDDSYVVG